MLSHDDEHDLHMHECTTYDRTRIQVSAVAIGSVIALLWATMKNLYGDDRRLRYPGRLVTCFGISVLMFHLLVALGWAIDFKQLDWGEGSNYHYYYDNDENGDQIWYDICTIQGVLIEICLISMAFYSAWISYAFYYVITMRFRSNYVLRQFNEENNLRFELRTHFGIIFIGTIFGIIAALRKNIGSGSGITACWIVGFHYEQIYYYYIWMILSVFSGVYFSIIATYRLYCVLKSSQSMWLVEHRSLRRVVYGNMMWSVFIIIIAILPVIDFLTTSLLICDINNICINCSGIMFYLLYNVFPFQLEKCFEDSRLRSIANESGCSRLNDSLFDNDYSYAERQSSTNTNTIQSSHSKGSSSHRSALGIVEVIDDDDDSTNQ